MEKRFKRKRKLKLKYKLFLKNVLAAALLIIIIKSNFFNSIFVKKINHYVNNTYSSKKKNINKDITNIVFKNVNYQTKNDNNNDELFTVKEEKNNKTIVYLYNTHQEEKYLDKEHIYKPTIMQATKYLNERLNNLGIGSFMENKSVSKIVNDNNWSYGKTYIVSRQFMEERKREIPDIKYFFDIHRDSGSHDYTTKCIDTKCYARILFVIGLENSNYMENQKFAENLNKKLNEKVNGISKGVLQKQGKNVNGVYNQDFSSRVLLIEVGGENNTIDEVYNTIEVLSNVIVEYIKEDNYGI